MNVFRQRLFPPLIDSEIVLLPLDSLRDFYLPGYWLRPIELVPALPKDRLRPIWLVPDISGDQLRSSGVLAAGTLLRQILIH